MRPLVCNLKSLFSFNASAWWYSHSPTHLSIIFSDFSFYGQLKNLTKRLFRPRILLRFWGSTSSHTRLIRYWLYACAIKVFAYWNISSYKSQVQLTSRILLPTFCASVILDKLSSRIYADIYFANTRSPYVFLPKRISKFYFERRRSLFVFLLG